MEVELPLGGVAIGALAATGLWRGGAGYPARLAVVHFSIAVIAIAPQILGRVDPARQWTFASASSSKAFIQSCRWPCCTGQGPLSPIADARFTDSSRADHGASVFQMSQVSIHSPPCLDQTTTYFPTPIE